MAGEPRERRFKYRLRNRLNEPRPRAEYETTSGEETIALGRKLARQIRAPLLVLLLGNLGMGKTTLAKGIASGLGAAREEDVTSPSFTLIHEYRGGATKVYHVDLYRLEGERDIASLGLEDLFEEWQPAVVLIEWGEKLKGLFPGAHWEIRFTDLGGDRRKIVVEEMDG